VTVSGFDYAGLFHVGVRVRDLDAAMDELGTGLGLRWSAVVEREQPVWTPSGGTASARLRFTYSAEGPQHVELLEGGPGSIWDSEDRPGVHHAGVWVDDVASVTEALVAEGWALEAAQRPPDHGYGTFTYVRSPSGFLLEPVSSTNRAMFERWWAGEPLG